MLTVLGGFAEFELELTRARTGEGRKRAKERGVKFGAPNAAPTAGSATCEWRTAGCKPSTISTPPTSSIMPLMPERDMGATPVVSRAPKTAGRQRTGLIRRVRSFSPFD